MERSRKPKRSTPDEIRVLLHFFSMLPSLEVWLNDILQKSKVKVQVKGVFCHKSGSLGPVVDFNESPDRKGCELADLLILVTHDNSASVSAFGNGCFLQAKVERSKISQGSSSKRQSALYCLAKSFRFKNPKAYVSSDFPDHITPGHRDMPEKHTSGFAFWSYDAFREHVFEDSNWPFYPYCPDPNYPRSFMWYNASSVMLPSGLDDPAADLGFGNAMYRILEGSLGIAVTPPKNDDFGWSRIVHDVVLRAIIEPLGVPRGIAGLDDVRRADIQIESLIGSGLAITKNPFNSLASKFGTEAMKTAAKQFATSNNRLNSDDLKKHFSNVNGDGPPSENINNFESNEDGSSGSFIQIHLSSE